MDSQKEPPVAQVPRPARTWLPKLEVDGVPIAYDATLRHYRGGHAGLVAEALEQPLLLPKDMEAYRNFNHPELFLSLKRELAMVSDSIHYSSFIHLIFLVFYSKSEIPRDLATHAVAVNLPIPREPFNNTDVCSL